MRERGSSTNRRLAVVAAIVIALGVTLVNVGVASAASRPSAFPIIKFIPAADEVTLLIPTPPCRNTPPGCLWKLSVNEPFEPGAPLLGVAIGTTGLLTVTYPPLTCGVVQGDASREIQADVSDGSQNFRLVVGHRLTIGCPGTTTTTGGGGTTTTTKPGGGTTTTTKPGGGTTTTTKPGGGGTTTTTTTTKPGGVTATTKPVKTKPVKTKPVKTKTVRTKAVRTKTSANHAAVSGATSSSTTDPVGHAVQDAAVTQLPFTGLDVRPLGLFGIALVMLGLALVATLETRRRALRRLRYAAQIQAARASRASRWFLGD
jgi:hypothetical protein